MGHVIDIVKFLHQNTFKQFQDSFCTSKNCNVWMICHLFLRCRVSNSQTTVKCRKLAVYITPWKLWLKFHSKWRWVGYL